VGTEELLEVIDERGNPTGEIKPKRLIHQNGDLHLGAHGFVTDGRGNMLCQLRGPDCVISPNTWDPTGGAGHVPAGIAHPGASIQVRSARTLIMEFSEEIGYSLTWELFKSRRAEFLGTTRTDMLSEHGWRHCTIDGNWGLILPGINPDTCKLEPGKVMRVIWRPAEDILRETLNGRKLDGFPYMVRIPDNRRLIETACNWALRVAQ
jgi:8-oxo-dGTP pyrophosphatase MutT (NUDIX family)